MGVLFLKMFFEKSQLFKAEGSLQKKPVRRHTKESRKNSPFGKSPSGFSAGPDLPFVDHGARVRPVPYHVFSVFVLFQPIAAPAEQSGSAGL
jgi:hypothetical protein